MFYSAPPVVAAPLSAASRHHLMSFWPSDGRPRPAHVAKRRKKRTDAYIAEADYPIASHGSLGALTLRDGNEDEDERVVWTTLAQSGDAEGALSR